MAGTHFLKKIPLNVPPYESVTGVAISMMSTGLINGFIYPIAEEKRFLTMNRPGLYQTHFCDLGGSSPVDGMFWWPAKGVLLASCGGKVYSINSNGVATVLTGTLTQGRTRFTQAGVNGADCIMASGGQLVYTTGTSLTAITAAGAPTSATFVAFLDSRIVANEAGTSQFKWSDPLSITAWNGLNLASMVAKGDTLQALDSTFDEILLVGKYSVEHYYNDGVSPFSKNEGLTFPKGTISPNSFIYTGNLFFWLDQDRNFIKLQGNKAVVISNPYATVIQNMTTVTDCVAIPIRSDGQNFIAWTFPTEGITLAYDVENEAWQGRWQTWNESTSSFGLWYPNCYCQVPDWGIHLVGDRRSGKIWKVSRQYMYDGDTPLHMVKTTGWRDQGIKRRKRSDKITISIQRGQAESPDTGVEPVFSMRSRDDGSTDWLPTRTGSLGLAGDTECIVEFLQNGIYRTRQDEYTFADNVPVVIIDAEEEGEILSR